LGNYTNYVRIGQLVNLLKQIANDLTVVLSGQAVPEGAIQLSSEKLFYIDQQVGESEGIQSAIKKAIELSPAADNLLVFTNPEAALLSESELRKIALRQVDYVSGSGSSCNKFSMRYAKHIVTTGETPSTNNAIRNGFSAAMSLAQMIRSPRDALRQYSTIVKFGLVGVSGVIVNLLVVTLLKSMIGVLASNAAGLELSAINNFCWNDRFTFRTESSSGSFFTLTRLYRFIKYNLVSLFSFGINEFVVYLAYYHGHLYYITSLLIGIATAFVVNYIGSSRWAWARTVAISVKD
jgi:putative flippase GtrA